MKHILILLMMVGHSAWGQEYQLASPISSNVRILLQGHPIKIGLAFRMDGAEIRYAIDTEPLTGKSKLYTDSLVIDKPCIIRAATFHPDYLTSDPIKIDIIDQKRGFASIETTNAHKDYDKGGQVLIDHELGGFSYSKGYLGYNEKGVEINATLAKKAKVKNVIVSALTSQNAWIFGPAEITILNERGKIIGHATYPDNGKEQVSRPTFYTIKCDGKKYKSLKIIIKSLPTIPDWHGGKGTPAWLFVDEVWYE